MNRHHERAHKYMKKKVGNKNNPYIVWKCMVPGCTHYITYELGENRHTICWRCGDTTILDKLMMELTRPHCRKCTKGAKRKVDEAAQIEQDGIDMLTRLFNKGA